MGGVLAALLALLLPAVALAAPFPAQAASPIKVTVTIHKVWEVHCDDNDSVLGDSCPNDYYVKVFFPDGERISPRVDDQADIEPNWQLSGTVDRDAGPFGVRIQLWDHDSTSGDDLLDISPASDRNLNFTVNPLTGDISGPELQFANIGYATGSGEDSAAIWFSVTLGETVDFDGDGLHDGIERSAIVADRFGTVPQGGRLRNLAANNLPSAQSASPCRPTVLVEIDFMADSAHSHRPQPGAVDEAVRAFNQASVPARPDCPYTADDRSGGVQLLMVIDDQLAETDKVGWAAGPGSTTGQSIRNANFDANLRPYYHYSLWVHNQPDNPPAVPGGPPQTNSSSGWCCSDSGKDVLVSLGAWSGNVGTVRDQSGTFLHELGHALGLDHGGGDAVNCKPNYHSAMSYVYQTTGIPDASLPAPTVDLNGDGTVDGRDRLRLDYSRVALASLDEDVLNEGAGIGAGPDTFFWDGDGSPPWRTSAGNVAVDWDRDNNIDAGTVAADINSMGIPGSQGCPSGTAPPGTAGDPSDSSLPGYNDWANLKYKAPLSPPSGGAGGGGHGGEIDKPTADFITAAIREAQSLTDMRATISDSPDPVGAGSKLTYSIGAHNDGAPNTAYSVKAEQTLPSDVTFSSASAGCAHAAGKVTCQLGNVAPGASASATVTVDVPADLVFNNGGPKDITSTVLVSHDGDDPDSGNNTATATTRVVAMADVRITGLRASGPLEVLIGEPASLSLDVDFDNAGPSSPIDTVLTTTAAADGGVLTPANSTVQQPALAKGSPRTHSTQAQLECTTPGVKTVTLDAELSLKNAEDIDPDLSNNSRSASFQIDCVVPVAINVRPGGYPNSINLRTDATIAALTTGAGEYGLPLDFDATQIDVSMTLWGLRENLFNVSSPSGAREIHGEGHPEDSYELDERTRDGDLDMVLHFKPADSGLTRESTEGCLKGKYAAPDGASYTFFGCDSVRVVGRIAR